LRPISIVRRGKSKVASAAAYFRLTRAAVAGSQVVARGRDAGAALGPDPAAAVATIA
jgi:hypothetical protein